jgi:hypothetical protein
MENKRTKATKPRSLLKLLRDAEVVCFTCGTNYGEPRGGVSSMWVSTCNVCGEEKAVTEVRDYGHLSKGIAELSTKKHQRIVP